MERNLSNVSSKSIQLKVHDHLPAKTEFFFLTVTERPCMLLSLQRQSRVYLYVILPPKNVSLYEYLSRRQTRQQIKILTHTEQITKKTRTTNEQNNKRHLYCKNNLRTIQHYNHKNEYFLAFTLTSTKLNLALYTFVLTRWLSETR